MPRPKQSLISKKRPRAEGEEEESSLTATGAATASHVTLSVGHSATSGASRAPVRNRPTPAAVDLQADEDDDLSDASLSNDGDVDATLLSSKTRKKKASHDDDATRKEQETILDHFDKIMSEAHQQNKQPPGQQGEDDDDDLGVFGGGEFVAFDNNQTDGVEEGEDLVAGPPSSGKGKKDTDAAAASNGIEVVFQSDDDEAEVVEDGNDDDEEESSEDYSSFSDDDGDDNDDNRTKKQKKQDAADESLFHKSHSLSRQRWSGATLQAHTAVGYAMHFLVSVNRALTFAGPCALLGVGGGQVLVGGFFLKKRCVIVPEGHTVVIYPIKKAMFRSAASEAPDEQQQQQQNAADSTKAVAETITLAEKQFGRVDWTWSRRMVKEWQERIGNLPSLVLVLTPTPADLRKSGMPQFRRDQKEEEQVERLKKRRPIFFAKHMGHGVHPSMLGDDAILASILNAESPSSSSTSTSTATTSAPRVIICGPQGVGKSTLGRFVCNALMSKYGTCRWVDLDLGQGEFLPPGTVGVTRLDATGGPLLHAGDCRLLRHHQSGSRTVEHMAFVGSITYRDPTSASLLLESVCDAATAASSGAEPLIINTHGWTSGVGFRVIAEAFQRLRPTHAIDMVLHSTTAACSTEGGKKNHHPGHNNATLTAERLKELFNPESGMNSSVVVKRFCVENKPRPVNPCNESNNNKQAKKKTRKGFQLTSLPVQESFRKPVLRLRYCMWQHWFASYRSVTISNVASCTQLSLIVLPDGDAVAPEQYAPSGGVVNWPWIFQRLQGASVALAEAPPLVASSSSASQQNGDKATTTTTMLKSFSSLVSVPRCLGFALVRCKDRNGKGLEMHISNTLSREDWQNRVNCLVVSEQQGDPSWLGRKE